jgi:hypothetical protein
MLIIALQLLPFFCACDTQAARLATLEEEMQRANQEYAAAVARASYVPPLTIPLHAQYLKKNCAHRGAIRADQRDTAWNFE